MNITVISGNIPGAIADLHKEQELVAGTGFRLVFAQDAKAYGLSKRVLVALLAPGCSAEGIVQATRRLSTAGRLRVTDHLINIPTVAFLLLLFGTLSAFGNAFYDLSKDILTAESSLGLSLPSWPSQSVALALLFLALLLPLGMFSRAAISGDVGSVTNTVANLFRRLFVPPTSRDIIATRIFRLLSKSRNVPSELRIICAFSASQEGRNDREIIDGLLHAAGKADIDARLYVPEAEAQHQASRLKADPPNRTNLRADIRLWQDWSLSELLSQEQQVLLQILHRIAVQFGADGNLRFLHATPGNDTDEMLWAMSRSSAIAIGRRLLKLPHAESGTLATAFDSLIGDFELLAAGDIGDLFRISKSEIWFAAHSMLCDAYPPDVLDHHVSEWHRAMPDEPESSPLACAIAFALEISRNQNKGSHFALTPTTRKLFSRIVELAFSAEAYLGFERIWPALRGSELPMHDSYEAFAPLRGLSTDTLRQLAHLLEGCRRYDEADFVYAYLAGAQPCYAKIRRARLMERRGSPRQAFDLLLDLLGSEDRNQCLVRDRHLEFDALLQGAWCVVSGFLDDRKVLGKKFLANAQTLAEDMVEGSVPPMQDWRLANYAAQYCEWDQDYPAALAMHRKALDTPGVGLKEVSGTLVNLGLTWRKQAIHNFWNTSATKDEEQAKAIDFAIDYGLRGYELKLQIGDLDELHIACHNLALTELWHALMADTESLRQAAMAEAGLWVGKALQLVLERKSRKKLDVIMLEGILCRRIEGCGPARFDEAIASLLATDDLPDPSSDTATLFGQLNAPMPLSDRWLAHINKTWPRQETPPATSHMRSISMEAASAANRATTP